MNSETEMGAVMGVVLQDRDRRILNTCYEQMFISADQIKRVYFSGVDARRARERILELERAGLVERQKVYGLEPISLIRLTKAGHHLAAIQNPWILPKPRNLDVSTLMHDLKLIDLRHELERCWKNFRWIPERAIKKSEMPEVPDALCVFDSGKKIAIELENSQKSKHRLITLLKRWNEIDVDLVLYFTTRPGIYRALQKIITEERIGARVGLIDFETFLTSKPPVWTPEGELHVFTKH